MGRQNNLLVREDVKAAMQNQEPAKKQRPTSANLMQRKKKDDTQRRARAQYLVKSQTRTADLTAEKILDKSRDTSATSARNIRRDLHVQQTSLNQRLQNRIRQRSVDIAAKKPTSNPAKASANYETEYESTLELFVEKKLTRLSEIKKKYKDITLSEEIRRKMNAELEQVVQDLEREKGEALAELKRKFEIDTKNNS